MLDGASDVLLAPDPDSFVALPWSPHSAILLCDVVDRTGKAVPFASTSVLRTATQKLDDAGFRAVVGLEVEFQVFEIADEGLAHDQTGMPPAPVMTRNTTQGYQYLTETRYGEAETLLDLLRRTAEQMGLAPRSMEIEMGPSQYEFTFDASDPHSQAARYVLFRTMVKEICQAQGLHASFMAKPKLPNAAANGWHIHQSLMDVTTGRNVFEPDKAGELTPEANGWIAGLLDHAEAMCLLTNPGVNSYKRFTDFQLAPNRIQWGRDNRGAMARALMYPGDGASRVENRVADTMANPYFAIAGQILSGLDGLQRKASAPAASETPYDAAAPRLPNTLLAAIEAFEQSPLIADHLGQEFVRYLAQIKRAEWDRYVMTISDWEQAEYFNLF